MTDYLLTTQEVKAVYQALTKLGEVFSLQGEPSFDWCGNTTLSLKQSFFPQYEKLLAFKGKKGAIELQEEAGPTLTNIYWGVRPCDLRAIAVLDAVFLQGHFVDQRYQAKREKSWLVGFFCPDPYESCFCTSLYDDLDALSVADIFFIKLGEDEYLTRASDRGEKILRQTTKLKKVSDKDLVKLQQTLAEFAQKFKIKFELGTELPNVKDFFTDPYFDEEAFKCISCGICTYLCPTCHCFVIEDKAVAGEGQRLRCWDHCQDKDFTSMAGGHNPRNSKGSRLRQRFMHKAYYLPEQHGLLGCVGCGRCLRSCPVEVDICQGLKHIRGKK